MRKKFGHFKQNIHPRAYVAQGAVIVGNVTIEEGSSIWYNSVVRGDVAPVKIGKNSNIQELSSIHTNWDLETIIGDNVTIGHGAILHGCKVGDNTLVGMGSIIMDGAEIGSNCIIGAGTLITQNKRIPDGSVVYGTPFEIKRQLAEEEKVFLTNRAKEYIDLARIVIAGEEVDYIEKLEYR